MLGQRLLGSLLVAALSLGAAGWAGYTWRDRGARADLAECQRVHAEALAITMRAAQQAEAEYRAREAQITQEHADALAVAHESAVQAHADAARVRDLLVRLRAAAARTARGGDAAPSAATASASAPGGSAGDLPPDLLWRIGQAAGELAAAADDARIAGLACERAYDAVTTPRLGVTGGSTP